LSRRRELISIALSQRFATVCERITALESSQYQEIAEFSTNVRLQLQAAKNRDVPQLEKWAAPDGWLNSDGDCLSALRSLILGEQISSTTPGEIASTEEFVQKLITATGDGPLQFELLTTRYRFPLNFLLATEEPGREYLLERLMVQDRARIERESVESLSADYLLLKLSLISIQASFTTDLRFLDALNYYYELLPLTWQPQSRHKWLLIAFFALYGRALLCYC
jgi:hypothetical protein